MQFLAVSALAGVAAAGMIGTGAPVYTTVTATAYTTYCPESTTFEFNKHTYVVTEAKTLTITDCPDHGCTWVTPVYTESAVVCEGGCGGSNYTAPAPTGTPETPVSPVPAEETDSFVAGAGRVAAFSGAALAGVLAFAAAL